MVSNLIKKLKPYLVYLRERCLPLLALLFPFIEINYHFGSKVFLSIDSLPLKLLYMNHLATLARFYGENNLAVFAVMVTVFISCSRGRPIKLTKFVRFNIIQAILLNIIGTVIGSIFTELPVWCRESLIGLMFANFIYLGVLFVIGYSVLLILYGRYPKIPVISEAARLQVQRAYLDD